jgi:hypothetical protein
MPRHAALAVLALLVACALSGSAAVPEPQLLPAALTVAPSTAVGMRYRLQLVGRPACPASHQLAFLSAPACSEGNQELDFNNWYEMATWDVALAAGQALGPDGSVLGVPVTFKSMGRARNCAGFLAASVGGAPQFQAAAGYTWVIERVPCTADQFHIVSKAARDAGSPARYLGGAAACAQKGVGLYADGGAALITWRFVPFQVPSGCRPKSASCAVTGPAGASNCCAGLACVPAAVGGGAVCATRPTPPSFKTGVATNAAGKVVITAELSVPADKGATRLGGISYEVVAQPSSGAPITISLTGGRRRAYFVDPLHGQLCGKAFTFTARAHNAVGWSDPETYPAVSTVDTPACTTTCKGKTVGCTGANSPVGRRLQTPTQYAQGDCCAGLYCIYSSANGPICVSKTTNPSIIGASASATATGAKIDVVVLQASDEGAGAIQLPVTYMVKATSGSESAFATRTTVSGPSVLTLTDDATPLCGKTWQLEVQTVVSGAPPSDWVAGPTVTAPACPPTCQAKGQGCDGLSRRRLQEFITGSCCADLYCAYDATEINTVCAAKPTNPSILLAIADASSGALVISVSVQGSSDEGAGATALHVDYVLRADDGNGNIITATVPTQQSPFTMQLAEPEHQLCGKAWQLAVQAVPRYAPPSDWVDGPTVTTPACAPTCKAKAQACTGASSGPGRRLQGPNEYVHGDCCADLYCINSSNNGPVCAAKTTNPAILSASASSTGSGATIEVQVQPSSDEGAGTLSLPASYTVVATSGSDTVFARAPSGPAPIMLQLTDSATAMLCGKTWQLRVQTTVALAPSSDLVDGPVVTAPACPP